MKVFRLPRTVCSRRFAAKAAMFRRVARAGGVSDRFTFTREDLQELYVYESTGEALFGRTTLDQMKSIWGDRPGNGFALCKWLRGIDESYYVEGVLSGDFCKAEYLSTAIDRIHNTPLMTRLIAPTWFPFQPQPQGAQHGL